MIPLYWFLLAWLILIAIYGVMSLLTVGMMLKFGLSNPTTYLSTALFLAGAVFVLLWSGSYLLNADWSSSIEMFGNVATYLNP